MASVFRNAARPILNTNSRQFTANFARNAARTTRRFQATQSEGAANTAKESWFKKAWDSPVGFKTVLFWYALPAMSITFETVPQRKNIRSA